MGITGKVIFVFGSNREGRHGKGAALEARKYHGAKRGQAEGLQGNSYAIVTKELRDDYKPVTLKEIKEGVDRFLAFAKTHPTWTFNVTPVGCGHAGRVPKQVGPMFRKAPKNVILPLEFRKYVRNLEDRFNVAWRKRFPSLPKPERQFKFHPKRKWRYDFAWPEYKVLVDIQGGTYTRGNHNRGGRWAQDNDYEKQNEAVRLGFRPLVFNTSMIGQIDSGKVYDCVEMTAQVLTKAKETE